MLTGTTRRRCAAILSIPLLLALVVVHAATARSATQAQHTLSATSTGASVAPVRHAATVEQSAAVTAPDQHRDATAVVGAPTDVPLPHGSAAARPDALRSTVPAAPLTPEGRAPPA